IRLALIYGSVASAEDRATSDVDVLIVGDDLALEDVYRRLGVVERKLGRKVNPTLYTSEEFRRRYESRNPFVVKLLTRKRIVLLGSEDAALEAAR
ncbi:MAG TPA: nucleotidyltransferase domain-containing protein, partial [Thermoanaerobaculia bacterium]|nr:nucleotidyltransferase domain-containing protein [Thermoanaerobaculia bacterium]